MAKTAAGLVAFVKTKLGTNYIYGMKGAVMTQAKFNQLRSMYPTTIPASDVKKVGTVCVDCSGTISWYTGIIRGSSNFKSTATKVLPISQIDQAVPGCAVWRKGHIGVYIGNGEIIEARGSAYGVVLTKVSSRNFTHILWLKDIDYSDASTAVISGPSVTTTANLHLRKSASAKSTSLGVIPKNTTINFVEDQGNGWSKVKWNAKTGYCSNKYLAGSTLSNASSTDTKTATTTNALNLRQSPSSLTASLGVIPASKVVTVIEDTDFGWSKVRYNSLTGYCSNTYLKGMTLSKKRNAKFTGTSRLNVRKTASTSAAIVVKINAKQCFVVNGYKEVNGKKWLDITYNTSRGWILYDTSYITLI